MTIYFYSPREKYGCFSNFSHHGFELNGAWWMTSEHYFQAQKFFDTPYLEVIRQAKTPKEAATIGRDRTFPLPPDWERVKDDIMHQAVLRKFEIHTNIRQILLDTGNELIAEKMTNDYYWGCGKDGSGKNLLGEILMSARQILRHCSAGE